MSFSFLPFLADLTPGHDSPGRVLLLLATALIAAKLAGALAERWGQPAVLGELLAGILLGPSLLGILPAAGSDAGTVFTFLAELGVVLLLFEIGLETDLKGMFRVGPAALAVAAVGVGVPFGLGFLFWTAGPHAQVASTVPLVATAIFVGATLTATSVGITARVLSDLGRLGTPEARIIVGAAVIDDVLGLVMLTVVSTMAAGGIVTATGIVQILLVAVGFLVAAVVLGKLVAPHLFQYVARIRSREMVIIAAVAFCFLLGGIAEAAGSALIIGAFAAGLILSGTDQFDIIEERVKPVVALFTPIFFVHVGGAVDLHLLDPSRVGGTSVLWIAGALTLLAVLGKVVAGWAAPWAAFDRLTVGVGMVPRGEVGLIFADIGRRTGVLGAEVFNAVLLMVLITTFLAPVLLKKVTARRPAPVAA